jgi:hypothetical protein
MVYYFIRCVKTIEEFLLNNDLKIDDSSAIHAYFSLYEIKLKEKEYALYQSKKKRNLTAVRDGLFQDVESFMLSVFEHLISLLPQNYYYYIVIFHSLNFDYFGRRNDTIKIEVVLVNIFEILLFLNFISFNH